MLLGLRMTLKALLVGERRGNFETGKYELDLF